MAASALGGSDASRRRLRLRRQPALESQATALSRPGPRDSDALRGRPQSASHSFSIRRGRSAPDPNRPLVVSSDPYRRVGRPWDRQTSKPRIPGPGGPLANRSGSSPTPDTRPCRARATWTRCVALWQGRIGLPDSSTLQVFGSPTGLPAAPRPPALLRMSCDSFTNTSLFRANRKTILMAVSDSSDF